MLSLTPSLAPSFATALAADGSMWSDMFTFQIPPAEKIVRTVVVYVVIAILIRVGGKRTLVQLNTSDLVVVLLLSNVVQNAIIGNDNSLSGGVLGAVVLIATNAVMDRIAFLGPFTERLFEGSPTTIIKDGQVVDGVLDRVGLRAHELNTLLHRQGADDASEVRLAQLQSAGSFDVQLMRRHENASTGELQEAVAELQRYLDERLGQLEARLR